MTFAGLPLRRAARRDQIEQDSGTSQVFASEERPPLILFMRLLIPSIRLLRSASSSTSTSVRGSGLDPFVCNESKAPRPWRSARHPRGGLLLRYGGWE